MSIMFIKTTRISAIVVAFLELTCGLMVAKAEQGVTATNTLNFSGHVWKVKSSEKRVGPGSNYFSDSKDNVWVDEAGRLHLRITKREGKWHCAEVISEGSFGFGTYRFYVSTPLSKLDPNITLGLFTWSDAPAYAHREIDIEYAKWGKAYDTNNAQFVVQPYQPPGRLLRYRVPDNFEVSTNYTFWDKTNHALIEINTATVTNLIMNSFLWQTNSVLFKCVEGHTVAPATNDDVIKEWNFTNRPIPQPGNENARMNLWLCTSRGPLDTNDTEVVISKFEFVPLKFPLQ
jgi:hypothetical protein